MKLFFKILIILLFGGIICHNVLYGVPTNVIQVGEELIYDVSFLSINLGTIRIVTLPDTNYQDEIVYHSKVFISSNPNIPFYSLKAIFNSLMDTTLSEGRYFESSQKEKDEEWGFQKITFRSKSSSQQFIHNEKWFAKEKINDTMYYNVGKVFDGSTLFFFARKHSGQIKSVKLPTIMDLDIENTIINFTSNIEKIKIKNIGYPIKTYYLSGLCDWKALYGLGGKFEAWFSADQYSIPIKAKMNVYVGNIDIELKSWKRNGWIPPKF